MRWTSPNTGNGRYRLGVGALEGRGYDVLGVTLHGPAPIGTLFVPFSSGVHALYGLNGAGKSRVLAAIRDTLQGRKVGLGGSVHLRFRDRPGEPRSALEGDIIDAARRSLGDVLNAGEMLVDLEEERQAVEGGSLIDLVAVMARTDGRRAKDLDQIDDAAATGGLVSLEAIGKDTGRWAVWASVSADIAAGRGEYERIRRLLGADVKAMLEHTDVLGTLPLAWKDFAGPTPPDRPSWVPLESVRLGELDGPQGHEGAVVHVLEPDVPIDQVDDATCELITVGEEELFAHEPSGQLMPEPEAVRQSISDHVTDLLTSIVGPGVSLEFVFGSGRDRIHGVAPHWIFCDERGTRIPITDASSSRRRWAVAAIELNLRGADVDTEAPVLLLSDEPEAGFHSTAVERLRTGLVSWASNTGAMALVATHAADILDPGRVELWHVRRDFEGRVTIDPGVSLDDDVETGLTPAQRFAKARAFLVVEGEHDELVLRELFGDEMDRLWVQVLPLRGAPRVRALPNSEWLLKFTKAPFLIVLDKIGAEATDAWGAARAAFAVGDVEEARRQIARVKDARPRSDEQGFLSSLGREAIETEVLDRLHVAFMTCDDILDYLDNPSDLARLKRKGDLTSEMVRAAVPKDEIHPDLVGLLSKVTEIIDACPGDL